MDFRLFMVTSIELYIFFFYLKSSFALFFKLGGHLDEKGSWKVPRKQKRPLIMSRRAKDND
jgi:hypothetical protein